MAQPQAWYFIRQTVDAAGILSEQDDGNNVAGIWVRLGMNQRLLQEHRHGVGAADAGALEKARSV